MGKSGKPELPTRGFASADAWRTWLAKNHATSDGLWLKFARKGSGVRSVSRDEAVTIALCYGWIDGQAKRIDDTFFAQRFVPRRRDSIWSRINREKALDLIASGEMQPAGMAAIEEAKANGRWDAAYDPPRTATVPPDLEEALAASPKTEAFFATLNSRNRYAILFRLQTVKSPATRAKRIEKFVAMLERGETLHGD